MEEHNVLVKENILKTAEEDAMKLTLNLNNPHNEEEHQNIKGNKLEKVNASSGKRELVLMMNTKKDEEEDNYQMVHSRSEKSEKSKHLFEDKHLVEVGSGNNKNETPLVNEDDLYKNENKDKVKEIVFMVDDEGEVEVIKRSHEHEIIKEGQNSNHEAKGNEDLLIIKKNPSQQNEMAVVEKNASAVKLMTIKDDEKQKLNNKEEIRIMDSKTKRIEITKQEKVEMKDKKIILNIEELEKQYLSSHHDQNVEGDMDSNNKQEMQRIQGELDKLHPRLVKDGKLVQYPLCASTGWFCCGGECGKSEIEKLGLGILCYFKVLKVFMICFLVISILNIPLYYIYYNNHTEKGIANYRDALFKTTIGNIASSIYNCQKLTFNSIITGATRSTYQDFSFDCGGNYVTSVVAFGLPTDAPEDSNDLFSCSGFSTQNSIKLSSQCNLNSYFNGLLSQNCAGKNKCSFQADLKYIEDNCVYTEKFNYFYFSYQCYDDFITVGYNDIKISRGVMGFIVVGIDVASILVLIICLFINSTSQQSNEKEFKERNILISDYTLHLKGVNFATANIFQHLDKLIKHFRSVLKEESELHSNDLLNNMLNSGEDITEDDAFGDFKEKINLNMVEKNILFDINYPMLTSDKLENILSYKQYNLNKNKIEIEMSKTNTEEERKKKLEAKLKEIENKIIKVQEQIKKEDKLNSVNELFLTFRNQKIANFYYQSYNKNKCVRCCYIFCCNFKKIKHFYFEEEWLDLKFTKDEPSNINWQNFSYNKCKRALRTCISIIIAILIMMVSFGVVIATKYSQDEIMRQFNTNIDCGYVSYSETLVQDEFKLNKPSVERINTYCFCYNLLMEKGYSDTEAYVLSIDKTITPCSEWLTLFIKFNSINAAIIIVIPVINSVLFLMMKWLTKFEKSKTLTEQLSSSMWKMFVLQFINTGMVIVLVNIYIKEVKDWWKDCPLFAGAFADLDPGWYSVVGVTILFTMIINMIIPHVTALLGVFVKYMKRCFDSGCSCGKRTHIKYKKDYFDLYVGSTFPIDVRYAEMLTTLFVALVYSSGIPILYFCILGYMCLTYLIDKILLLRVYRIPPKYDLYMAKMFNVFIIFAILLHYAFGIWIYGNPNLLADNTSSSLDTIKSAITTLLNFNNEMVKNIAIRISMPHNIICLIFWGFLIILFILRVTVFSFLGMLCSKNSNLQKKNLEIGLAIPFKSLNRNYELRKLQFMKLMKNSQLQHEKDSLAFDNVKNYFQIGINYDREFLKYKLEKLSKMDLKHIDNNFDDEIKSQMSKLNFEEDPIIGGDVSFNIAYIPEYESIAYYEYLKNIY